MIIVVRRNMGKAWSTTYRDGALLALICVSIPLVALVKTCYRDGLS